MFLKFPCIWLGQHSSNPLTCLHSSSMLQMGSGRPSFIRQVKIAFTSMFSGQQLFSQFVDINYQYIQSHQKFNFFIRYLYYSSTWLAIVFLCNILSCKINSMPFVRFHWSSCMYVWSLGGKSYRSTGQAFQQNNRGNKSKQLQSYSVKERPAAPGLGSEIAKEGTERRVSYRGLHIPQSALFSPS